MMAWIAMIRMPELNSFHKNVLNQTESSFKMFNTHIQVLHWFGNIELVHGGDDDSRGGEEEEEEEEDNVDDKAADPPGESSH